MTRIFEVQFGYEENSGHHLSRKVVAKDAKAAIRVAEAIEKDRKLFTIGVTLLAATDG